MDYSKSSFILAFVAVLLHLCIRVECSNDNVECHSRNEDEENNSTCEESNGCWATNTLQNQELERHVAECFPSNRDPPNYSYGASNIKYGANVDSCLDTDDLFPNSFGSCTSSTLPDEEAIYYLPTSVTATLSSAGLLSFDMSVSWMHNDFRDATSLEGYEIRLIKRNKSNPNRVTNVACICVRNTSQLNYEMPLSLSYEPQSSFSLEVSVSTFPRTATASEPLQNVNTAYNKQTDWPANCSSVIHSKQDCSPPQLQEPTNIQAKWSQETSSASGDPTERLDLSWDPPPNTMNTTSYRMPHVYYIHVISGGESFKFQTNNTRNVSLYGLNSTLHYDVRVRAYEPCSGFEALTATSFDRMSCGLFSEFHGVNPFVPPPTIATHTTTDATTATTMATTTQSTPTLDAMGPVDGTHAIGIPIGVSIAIVIIIVIVVGVVAVAIYISRRCRPSFSDSFDGAKSNNGIQPILPEINNVPCHVLVVFPLDTPLDKEAFIRAKISELEFYEDYSIKVEFIKDYNSGIVAVTWENQIRIATKVLLICTPEFCKEWANIKVESPNFTLFHLLKAELTSTVNTSNKYTAVAFNKRHTLPKNNFLSAIPRIDIESESDIEHLLRHITNTSLFVYAQTFDHQPSLPNHYTLSAVSPVQPSSTYNGELYQHENCHQNTMEDCEYGVQPSNTTHAPTSEHLNIILNHSDSEFSDQVITPTSDVTVETLSTSTSECSIETA